jgi:biotin carboxyl carrier protein
VEKPKRVSQLMKITFDNTTLDLIPKGKGWLVSFEDKTSSVELLRVENGQLELLMDGERVVAYASSDNAKRWVTVNGRTYLLVKQSGARRSGGGHHHTAGELTAPMPGQVRAVNVSAGDAVTKGQTLLVIEAMKMEIRIQAPMDGVVKTLSVKQGQIVEREQVLVEIA